MAAYVFVNIEITDPVRYEEYKKMAVSTVTAHGGRYIARGGHAETLEGTWRPERVVLLPDGVEDLWSADYLDLVALA